MERKFFTFLFIFFSAAESFEEWRERSGFFVNSVKIFRYDRKMFVQDRRVKYKTTTKVFTFLT